MAQTDQVIATARNVSQIQDLKCKYPQTGSSVRLDVTDQASIHTAVQSGLEVFGKIDVFSEQRGLFIAGRD